MRYPADFDAVVAGAPAVNYMHLHAGRMAINRSVNATPEAVIPPAKYPLLHRAALAACDAGDGVADGVIENPVACTFDPRVLRCTAKDDAACLTPAQIQSALTMYGGATHPGTKASVLPGLAHGSELGWAVIGSPEPVLYAAEAFKYIIAKDPAWDATRFDPAVDLDRALAADPDDARRLHQSGPAGLLRPRRKAPAVPRLVGCAGDAVQHHRLLPEGGRDQRRQPASARRCSSTWCPAWGTASAGRGTDTFDKIGAIESWIATGTAPARIDASHLTDGVVDRTRPVCPFGQVARWDGRGSPDSASSFSCVAITDTGR